MRKSDRGRAQAADGERQVSEMQRFGDRPSPDALIPGNALCERHRPLASHPKGLGVLPDERRVGREREKESR